MSIGSQNLNDKVAEIPVKSEDEIKSKLLPKVALSDKILDYENKKIVFTFLPYKYSQCEIVDLQKNEAKRLTEKLKEVNKTIAKVLLFSKASGLNCKPTYKSGQYACLYVDLPSDAEILEINYTDTGRIFGYLVENIFNIVAIKRKHLK